MHQINEIIHDAVGDDAEIIFGAVHEPAMQGEIRVTVIATGFDRPSVRRSRGSDDIGGRNGEGTASHSFPGPAPAAADVGETRIGNTHGAPARAECAGPPRRANAGRRI